MEPGKIMNDLKYTEEIQYYAPVLPAIMDFLIVDKPVLPVGNFFVGMLMVVIWINSAWLM